MSSLSISGARTGGAGGCCFFCFFFFSFFGLSSVVSLDDSVASGGVVVVFSLDSEDSEVGDVCRWEYMTGVGGCRKDGFKRGERVREDRVMKPLLLVIRRTLSALERNIVFSSK